MTSWMTDQLGRDFAGKRVLVTGSSRGIGAAVAQAFAELGAHIAIHAHASVEPAQALAAEWRKAGHTVHVLSGDFTVMAEAERVVDSAIEKLGGLDILINNAGTMMGRKPLAEIDDGAIVALLALNAGSAVAASRRAIPVLKASRGTIINTTSIAARNGGSNGAGAYAAAKAFVSTYTRGLATELAGDGIRVNAVSPGTIMTDFHRRYSTPDKLAETAALRIPMKRIGTAEDCVGAYLFLASASLAGYITGQIIEVNGGQLMP
jgi:3-oxoacyl-[acyl-carrier protein] reductase